MQDQSVQGRIQADSSKLTSIPEPPPPPRPRRPATQKVHQPGGPGLDAGGEEDASYAGMRSKESQIFKIVYVAPNPFDLIFIPDMA